MRFQARSPEEAAWWESASPKERLAFFLGVQRGLGYRWPGPDAMRQLRARFAVVRTKARHDPNAPCAEHDCTDPVGEWAGVGRIPTRCPKHRNNGAGARTIYGGNPG